MNGPDVVHNPVDDEYLVAWSESEAGGGHDIRGRRLASDGAPLGGAFRIGGVVGEKDLPAQVAHDPVGNEYLVVWWNVERDAMFGRRIAADGSRLGVKQRISGDTIARGGPAAVFDAASAAFVVVWSAPDAEWPRTRRIWGSTVTSAGVAGEPVLITGPRSTSAYDPTAAVNAGAGEVLVAWTDGRLADTDGRTIFGQRVVMNP